MSLLCNVFIQPTMHDRKRTDIPQNARQQAIKIQLKGILPIALILGCFLIIPFLTQPLKRIKLISKRAPF